MALRARRSVSWADKEGLEDAATRPLLLPHGARSPPELGFPEALTSQLATLKDELLRQYCADLAALGVDQVQTQCWRSSMHAGEEPHQVIFSSKALQEGLSNLGKITCVSPRDSDTMRIVPSSRAGPSVKAVFPCMPTGDLEGEKEVEPRWSQTLGVRHSDPQEDKVLAKWSLIFTRVLAELVDEGSGRTAGERCTKQYRNMPLKRREIWNLANAGGHGFFSLSAPQQPEMSIKRHFGDSLTGIGWSKNFVGHPQGPARLLWGLLGTCLLGYDALSIPLQVFELGTLTTIFDTVNMLTALYWFLDIPLGCLVGFQYDNGLIEMRLRFVALHYLKTQFPFDVSLVLIDGLLMAMEKGFFGSGDEGGSSSFLKLGGRSLRLVRLLRLLRLVRLLRIRKSMEFMQVIHQRLRSIYTVFALQLIKNLFGILLINHYIACSFCALSSFADDDATTWVRGNGLDEDNFSEVYIIALHWSLTQFSPATNNIAPKNSVERTFAILVVLFALIAFSSFISSVTNTVNQARLLLKDTMVEEANIRQYMFERSISTQLFVRTQDFFKQNYAKRNMRLLESDIKFFGQLPESLKIQMHEEIFMPVLRSTPLFQRAELIDRPSLVRLCHNAFSEECFVSGIDVFIDGIDSEFAYYVSGGNLRYTSACIPEPSNEVVSGMWMSEICLWVHWVHHGQLCAESISELVKLKANTLEEIAQLAGESLIKYFSRFAIYLVGHAEMWQDTTNRAVTDLPFLNEDREKLAERAYLVHNADSKRLFRVLGDQSPRGSAVSASASDAS